MKRLIVFSATGFLIVLAIVLLMRVGPGAAPAQAQDPPPVPTPAEQLATAEQLRFQLKWDEAIALLRQVVARQQEDRASAAKAQARIGKYLLDKGKAEEARPELNLVLDAFGDVGEAVFWARVHLIDVLFASNELTQAEAWATQLADDVTLSPQQRAWGQVKQAEVDLERCAKEIAAERLSDLVQAAGDQTSEPHNWARVRLAQIATQAGIADEAIAIADAIVADHGNDKATDQQVVWGLIWKGRALAQKGQYEATVASLSMAGAVSQGKYPDLTYETEMQLGETYRQDNKHVAAWQHYERAFSVGASVSLSEHQLDHACLQVGSELRHLGMRERGIAWLRMAIKDPAGFTGMDHTLSERMVSFMTPEEAEAWHEYLLAPAQTADPTNAFVLKEFKTTSPGPSSAWVDSVSSRQFWLGRLYEKQQRASDAKAAFEQALSAATLDRERGEALLRLAPYRREAEGRKAGLQTAKQASDLWLKELDTSVSDGDAHYAIEMAFSSYDHAGFPQETIALLEQLVASISPDLEPARACFARYYLINKYVCYSRNAEAKALAEETTELFRTRVFAQGHDWLCSRVLIYLAYLHAREGDSASAAQALDEVESRWPGLAASVAGHRLSLQNLK